MRTKTWINVAIYLGFTALSSLLGLGSAVLLAHLLVPEEFGRLGIFLSSLYIVAPVVSMSAEGLVAVNKTTLSAEDYESFQRTAVGLSLIACLLCSIFLAVGFGLGWLPDALLVIAPLFALIRFWATMASTEYVAEQRAMMFGLLTVLNSLVALGLTYLLAVLLVQSAASRIAALLLADATLLFIRYRGRLRVLMAPCLNSRDRRQILNFGLPGLVALLGAWGLNEADKFIVARGIDLRTAGQYTAAAALAAVMMSFYQAITNALFPSLYRQLANDPSRVRALILTSVAKFSCLTIGFAVALMGGYTLVGSVLLPARYAESASYFYALVCALMVVALYRPLGLFIDYFKMARVRAVAVSVGGLTSVLVAWFGIRAYHSALWAAVGIGAGYAVAAAVLLAALINHSHQLGKVQACRHGS